METPLATSSMVVRCSRKKSAVPLASMVVAAPRASVALLTRRIPAGVCKPGGVMSIVLIVSVIGLYLYCLLICPVKCGAKPLRYVDMRVDAVALPALPLLFGCIRKESMAALAELLQNRFLFVCQRSLNQ